MKKKGTPQRCYHRLSCTKSSKDSRRTNFISLERNGSRGLALFNQKKKKKAHLKQNCEALEIVFIMINFACADEFNKKLYKLQIFCDIKHVFLAANCYDNNLVRK